jgi:hypothetical protein
MEEPKVNCGMLIQMDVNILEDGLANGSGERVLALTFFGARQMVRVLPGGRVLFAGAELTLPAAGSNLPRMQLFTIEGRGAPVRVPCDPDALPVDAGYFVPSPDGRRVALAEPGSDTVAILSIDSGEVQLISPNRGAKSRTFPTWRGADELFFAALPAAGARRPEMVRWSKGKTDVFSAAWDDAAVADFVEMPAQK